MEVFTPLALIVPLAPGEGLGVRPGQGVRLLEKEVHHRRLLIVPLCNSLPFRGGLGRGFLLSSLQGRAGERLPSPSPSGEGWGEAFFRSSTVGLQPGCAS